MFIGSLLLFALSWLFTSSSIVKSDKQHTTVSSSHNTGMAGSLAQISEKTEYETDHENELAGIAVCLPFILSFGRDNGLTMQGLCFPGSKQLTSQSIFKAIRNFRI